jgi:hypothetical protein
VTGGARMASAAVPAGGEKQCRRRRIVPAVVLACTLVVGVTNYFDERISPYLFDGDAAQHVWWTYKWADPELFPNDPAQRFFSLPLFAPLGYQAVYRTLVPLLDAQVLSESLTIPLLALTALGCFMVFRRWCGGDWLGPAVGVLILLVGFGRFFRCALPRAFALPTLVLLAWLSSGRRVWPLGLGLIAVVLFYPPLALVAGFTTLIVVVVRWFRRETKLWDVAAYGTLSALACVTMVVCYLGSKPAWVGERPTIEQMRAMEEFRRVPGLGGGRGAVFGVGPVEFYLSGGRMGLGGDNVRLVPLLALALGALLYVRPRASIPPFPLALLVTSLALFVAAHALMPRLFYPNRHVRYAFPLAVLALTALAVARSARAAAVRRPALGRLAGRFWWLALVPFAALAARGVVGAVHTARTMPAPDPSLVAVVEFCRATPKEALFAGPPDLMDDLPMLTRRSVLANNECALPQYLGYYGIMRGRLEDELRLLYAASWPDALALAKKHGVDYVIVPHDFLAREGFSTHPPTCRLEERLRDEARRAGAIMLSPPPGRRVLRTERNDIVDVRPEPESPP